MFGGLFTYVELLNLDARDLAFWLRAARRKLLFDQLRTIQAFRSAMASDQDYLDEINKIKGQIAMVDQEEVIKRNWDELKLMKHG